MRILSTTLAVSALAALMGSSAAMAADMSTPVVPYVAPTTYAPAPASNWDGVFIGIFGGAGMGFADHTSLTPGNDINLSGMFVGASIGANMYLSDSVVGGVEADIAWANLSGISTSAPGTSTHTVNWMGSLRGVLGYDAGTFMPYVTGGVAFANATRDNTSGGGYSANATHVGYTVGAGVEIAATDNLVVDLQYRYSGFGGQEYVWSPAGPTDPTIALSTHTVSAGLKWQMN